MRGNKTTVQTANQKMMNHPPASHTTTPAVRRPRSQNTAPAPVVPSVPTGPNPVKVEPKEPELIKEAKETRLRLLDVMIDQGKRSRFTQETYKNFELEFAESLKPMSPEQVQAMIKRDQEQYKNLTKPQSAEPAVDIDLKKLFTSFNLATKPAVPAAEIKLEKPAEKASEIKTDIQTEAPKVEMKPEPPSTEVKKIPVEIPKVIDITAELYPEEEKKETPSSLSTEDQIKIMEFGLRNHAARMTDMTSGMKLLTERLEEMAERVTLLTERVESMTSALEFYKGEPLMFSAAARNASSSSSSLSLDSSAVSPSPSSVPAPSSSMDPKSPESSTVRPA